jgi:hypothetical protein
MAASSFGSGGAGSAAPCGVEQRGKRSRGGGGAGRRTCGQRRHGLAEASGEPAPTR